MIFDELEREIALKELQLENYVGLRTEFDIRKEEDLLRVLKHLKPIALERYSPEPVAERVAPFELPGVTTDWDFCSTNWALDTSVYVSAPSSVRFRSYNFALLKKAVAGRPITNGRIETNYRVDQGYGIVYAYYTGTFVFRSDAPDGSVAPIVSYVLELYGGSSGITNAALMRCSSSSCTAVATASLSPTLANATWYKVRTTWWVSSGVLVVRLEYYNGEQWSSLCPDFTDNANANDTNTTNRAGVGSGSAATYGWHDDTVIYVAV